MSDSMIDALCSAVSAPTMMQHLEEFARRVKLSGTLEELESFRYLQSCLESYGYSTELIRHDAYISLPGAARIEAGGHAPRCITHSFSCPSAPGGTRGAVVYAGSGSDADFGGRDVRGRIVLLEGIANPGASRRASDAGAIGQIHISPHEHIHEMCISPVWGSPTPQTRANLPRTVVVSVLKSDGDALKQRLVAGEAVEAVLHAEVDTGWRKTPLLTAELAGEAGTDGPFVLLSGHHDTWYYGVMDNGGANATMLEVARLFAADPQKWRRGLRICFWSGHSHGRYSGSAWYADHHWDELARRCVAHVNVDSTGAKGNTVLTDALASAELVGLATDAVGTRGGQHVEGLRMSRAGDQSFWGIGVPSIFMAMGEQPSESAANVTGPALGGGARKGAGLGWWWHTPEDTLDKMDPEMLVRDTRIYVHTVGRLLTDRILPLDYAAAANALGRVVAALEGQLKGRFDLTALVARVDAFRRAADAAGMRAGQPMDDAEADRLNRALVAVSRAIVPVDYTHGDRFDHDPALPQSPYPVLDFVRRLAAAPDGSDDARFLEVAATRARNRLVFALDQAIAALEA